MLAPNSTAFTRQFNDVGLLGRQSACADWLLARLRDLRRNQRPTGCGVRLVVQELEERNIPSWVGYASPSTSWLTPGKVAHAYRFDQISAFNGVTANGTGQTIAIIGYDDNPNLIPSVNANGTTNLSYPNSDLHAFDTYYSLNDFSGGNWFKKIQIDGLAAGTVDGLPFYQESPQRQDINFEGEETLDVEWAHAMAPGANTLLVEVPYGPDPWQHLIDGVKYAGQQSGVSVVSLSLGLPESQASTAIQQVESSGAFRTPGTHQGVTFLAASGDAGDLQYPASSANVLAVGGTTLSIDSNNNYVSEAYWNNGQTGSGGGGQSAYIQEPSYQENYQQSNWRQGPDVSYDAGGSTK